MSGTERGYAATRRQLRARGGRRVVICGLRGTARGHVTGWASHVTAGRRSRYTAVVMSQWALVTSREALVTSQGAGHVLDHATVW
eukprot:260150-Rhodomonas_salina.1